MAWFVVYQLKLKDLPRSEAENIILLETHPIIWAAGVSRDYRETGTLVYLLWFCEIPDDIDLVDEAIQRWCRESK